MTQNNQTCWVITEGIAGTENQCLGLAEALCLEPAVKRIKLNPPWAWLTPYLRIGNSLAISNKGDKIAPPWPDIAICSGRKSIPAALYIKKASKGKTFVIQIQDPRCPPELFDMVIAPSHDPIKGDNVYNILGGLNRINTDKLHHENQKFPPFFKDEGRKKIAILLGGKSKAHHFSNQDIGRLIEQFLGLAKQYNLMVTASRRTEPQHKEALLEALGNHPHIHFYDGGPENPYFAYLARANIILVSADSVSMISEALTCGKPTYIIEMNGGGKRLDLFHKHIFEQGYARQFRGHVEEFETPHLNETQRMAKVIEERLKTR